MGSWDPEVVLGGGVALVGQWVPQPQRGKADGQNKGGERKKRNRQNRAKN